MSIERVLRCCVGVARLGERDAFQWWESDAASVDGAFWFQRLFPRTYHWAGLEMAIEAARARHATFLPGIPVITLFNLTGEVDAAADELLFRRKIVGEAMADEDLPSLPQVKDSVAEMLVAMGIASRAAIDRLRSSAMGLGERNVCLGEVVAEGLESAEAIQSIVQRLAAAYCFSGPRKLVVPYYRLKDR